MISWPRSAIKHPRSCLCILLSLPSGMGERIERTKVRKFTGQDKNSLTGEKNKAATHHVPQAEWCPASLQSIGTVEGNLPSLCPLPLFLLLSTVPYGVDHPFGQFRSAVLAMSPPSFLPTSSLLAEGTEWGRTVTASMLCKHCSAVAKTLECYQH